MGTIALTAAMTTLAAGPAFATHDGTGEADASASTGTGQLFELLDTGACTATDTETTESGTPSGRCGDGLSLNDQIKAFSQNAAAPGDGTSAADASVAPIDIKNFTALDLTGIFEGLQAIDTGTVLDQVIQGVDDAVLRQALEQLSPTVIKPIDDALQDALSQVNAALPLTLQIGAVEAQCTAVPGTAKGTSTVAGIDLLVDLGGQQIHVPITAGTAPNSNLLIGAPQDLVDGIIAGLRATFTDSLGGALAPLNQLLSTVQEQVTNTIFAQLEAQLLPPLADALKPLIMGTVNEQQPVSPSSTGEISVTALDLTLLGNQNLQLARTHCGPNTAGTPHETTPTATPTPTPDKGEPTIPTVVDSGSQGDNNTWTILGATGALMLVAGATGLAGYRRLLQK